jgi:hypothetical protein
MQDFRSFISITRFNEDVTFSGVGCGCGELPGQCGVARAQKAGKLLDTEHEQKNVFGYWELPPSLVSLYTPYLSMAQKPPQRIDAPAPGANPATFIFLHGFGDDADGWTSETSFYFHISSPSNCYQPTESARTFPHCRARMNRGMLD